MSVVPDSKEPNPIVDLTPPAEAPVPAPAALGAQTAVTDRRGLVQASVYSVLAALIAGFVAWGLGEKTFDYYRPSAKGRDPRLQCPEPSKADSRSKKHSNCLRYVRCDPGDAVWCNRWGFADRFREPQLPLW